MIVDKFGIQVIRTLWGDSEHHRKEILKASKFDDEVVMVYGLNNFNFLKSLGYNCILVSEDNLSHLPYYKQLYYKLHSLVQASNHFKKILFLDWDVTIVKPLDQLFWDDLKDRVFSAPSYAWNFNFEQHLLKAEEKDKIWLESFIEYFPKYSWSYLDGNIIPNACFVYLSNPELSRKLLSICEQNNLIGLSDEFSLFSLAECSLEEYMKRHEPKTIFASKDNSDSVLNGERGTLQKPANDYIRTLVEKNIYLEHH